MSDQMKPWRKMERHLREWAAELEEAKARTDNHMEEARRHYYERIRELQVDITKTLKKWDAELGERGGAVAAAGLEARKLVNDLRSGIDSELQRWEPEIDRLKARAGQAQVEAKRLVKELKVRRKEAEEQLKRLKKSAGESWQDIRPAIERAWAELRPALSNAVARFRTAGTNAPRGEYDAGGPPKHL